MTFNRFYHLCESPDIVYTNAGVELNWSNEDARAFGWLNIIPNTSPILLYTAQSGATHFEIVYMVLELFQYARSQNTTPIKRAYNRDYKEYFGFYPTFEKVIDVLSQNKQAWSSIVSGRVESEYNKKINKIIGDEEKPVTTEMSDRRIAFKDSGRIWLQSKIISFWATEVTESLVSAAFNAFNVPKSQRSGFLIDLIDPENLENEETKNKILPTVAEYFLSLNKKQPLTQQQQKRIAELMAKRHTETDPSKKKMIQHELEQYGQGSGEPTGPSKRIALDVRQKMMTSENYNFREYFSQCVDDE